MARKTISISQVKVQGHLKFIVDFGLHRDASSVESMKGVFFAQVWASMAYLREMLE